METKIVKLSQVAVNKANPRVITDGKFQKLVNSVLTLPKMLGIRPIVVDDTMTALGGNMRYRALTEIAQMKDDDLVARLSSIRDFQRKTEAERDALVAYWLQWLANPTTEVINASELSEDERREFIIKDNVGFGEWDYDMLANEWEKEDLDDWGVDVWQDDDKKKDWDESNPDVHSDSKNASLFERFIVPPFSILDTRAGYWQERKKKWRTIVSNTEIGQSREGTLIQSLGIRYKDLYARKYEHRKKLGISFSEYLDKYVPEDVKAKEDAKVTAQGTSLFDPVLAEVVMRWFCPPEGRIIDPFGGEQTKGVVAGELGLTYRAVEIRPDQVEANTEATKSYRDVRYICGDSNKISELLTEDGFDLCFTSPPYYDLEVYSKEDMSALGTYEEFMAQYENIFRQCVAKLADNSFLVVKVGEIRNKKTGAYRNFVGDNTAMFMRLGLHFYNEIILIEPPATAAIRAGKCMESRKVSKTHQNILVFFKGDMTKIRERFPKMDYSAEDVEFFKKQAQTEEDTNEED